MDNLGQRVKNFREAKGLTQQELELEIGAACGHISRIESGKINPTKETLFRISEALRLTQKEKDVLFGLSGFPSKSVIEEAIAEAKSYLASTENIALLSDNFWFGWDANDKMLQSLGLEGDYQAIRKDFSGSHLLDWFFNPELPFRGIIPEKLFEETAVNQLAYFIKEINLDLQKNQSWFIELYKKCLIYPDFKECWEKALILAQKPIQRQEKFIKYILNGKEILFYISEIKLNNNPHFEIIEYIPQKI